MKKNNVSKLHRKEEKYHHIAERAMEADEKIHERLEKAHKKEEKMKVPKIKAIKISIKPVKMKKQEKPPKPKPVKVVKNKDGHNKVKRVMEEFAHHELHSGSKKGPLVKNRKQAIAIGLSEARKAGEYVKPKKKK